ncbi:metallophosphoesterase family protein [Actinomadura bangladeshensis]|uniref:DNA repair exonuclease n=1 Tax=Actinomadura bangladeshensis TaxID=453573 RepID=A0A6L9Q9Y0_9ACTN|nr:DNA repair exonuclease [Actinomadura bangladeshensis]NEA22211.1 DNA repair exonuclease [Actinomadura bangladeshensis]
MKFLHAADLHIDSPLRGLSAYEGAPEEDLRLATRRALENLVRLAIELPVDAVLLAGDVYDGDWKDYQTGLYFSGQMARLGRAGIPVYMVSGNHDAQNRTMRSLRLPGNVRVFATHRPETVRDEKAGLAVHGQGFAEWDLTDNLAAGYPQRDGGLFNVGLLHTGLDAAHSEHKLYAPCSVADLEARGYDYWALGHIHTRQIVREEPWIVYPGNIQGRHARETGPKGCTVVTVDGDLQVESVEHHDLDTARWERLDVDVTGRDDIDQVLSLVAQRFQKISEERLTAVRVTLTGATSAHTALWRDRERILNELRAAAGHHPNLWLEKLKVRTSSEDGGDSGAGASGILTDLRRTLSVLGTDPDGLMAKLSGHPLIGRIPPEIKGPEGIASTDPAWIGSLADDAYQLVESLLQEAR